MKRQGLKKKALVAMSGGVDSSVAAALLKRDNYEVVGAFIKVWVPPGVSCNWRAERREAMRVAACLEIPLITVDLSAEYKKSVIDYMLREYRVGRTPNPDIECNREIKFGAFFKRARKFGADYVATGHYSRSKAGSLAPGQQEKIAIEPAFSLLTAVDREKDQSYFLWTINQAELRQTIFPIGDYKKAEVRKLAKKFGLPNAEKKDSQGLCFLGQFDFKEFLKNYIETKSGAVLDTVGRVIGEHRGAILYTIGERHGFSLNEQSTKQRPLYVVAKDLLKNTLTVSPIAVQSGNHRGIKLERVNWISGAPPEPNKAYQARIRYRGELLACTLKSLPDNNLVVVFVDPPLVSPGQSLVVYDGEFCLGGGIIS